MVEGHATVGPLTPVEMSNILPVPKVLNGHLQPHLVQMAVQLVDVHELDIHVAVSTLNLLKKNFGKIFRLFANPKTDRILGLWPILTTFLAAHLHCVTEHHHGINALLHDQLPEVVRRVCHGSLRAQEASFTFGKKNNY